MESQAFLWKPKWLAVTVTLISLVGLAVLKYYEVRKARAEAERADLETEQARALKGQAAPVAPSHDSQAKPSHAPAPHSRVFLNYRDVWAAIGADLHKLPPSRMADRRYVTLTHLHNNLEISDHDLDGARSQVQAIFGRLAPVTVALTSVDQDKTIYGFQLSEIGWAREHWDRALTPYPYGLDQTTCADPIVSRASRESTESTDCLQPLVRGDWLVHHLSVGRFEADPGLAQAATKVREAFPAGPPPYETKTLSLAAIAAEVSVSDVKVLESVLRRNPVFRQKFALAPVLDGGAISRKAWEVVPALTSPFQELSRELEMGTPIAIH